MITNTLLTPCKQGAVLSRYFKTIELATAGCDESSSRRLHQYSFLSNLPAQASNTRWASSRSSVCVGSSRWEGSRGSSS